MRATECVAMILAGGQGSRLGVLTSSVAKPAVPFGGKYRIIDFALSNCVNSGIDTVGILTQYRPLELNTYIGSGSSWDLDRNNGGIYVLPPYQTDASGEWYKGTANAIYQNMEFIEQFNPKYVLILSGDHIYKMHYGKMIDFHREKGADVTIAVIDVPIEEASRFGIMTADKDMQITKFEEKPENPESTLASMGVYVFSYQALKKYLNIDEHDPESNNDFGKNIIPKMLHAGEKMFAYSFDGYWKDVGTIQSLWEANMDLLKDPPVLDLDDSGWKIFSRNPVCPPHFIKEGSVLENSLVTDGCNISGEVKNSILFESVTVEDGAKVTDSIIFPGSVIGKNAVVNKSIIGTGTVIGDDAIIGDAKKGEDEYKSKYCSNSITLIGGNLSIANESKVGINAMVEESITKRK